MNVLHQLPHQPDAATMADMVQQLYRYALRGKVELAWTSPSHPHPLTGARLFGLEELDELVDHAVSINCRPNRNVYITGGLRKEDVTPDRRGSKEDVTHMVGVWADCDTPGCLENALRLSDQLNIPPSYVMTTGMTPSPRGALWWLFEEPSDELERCSNVIKALAAKFGSDAKVFNPDRVMRLAGSVAWPLKAGRVLELTASLPDAITRAAPYTLDEIESVLRKAGAMALPVDDGAVILDFNQARPILDLESLIHAARKDGNWHDSALKAVAHLMGRGLDADLVEDTLTVAMTMPGYALADTRRDIQVMIRGAAAKGWTKPKEQAQESGAVPFVSIADLLNRAPPNWLVDGFFPDNGLSILWGASGTFKSFIALDIAMSVAHGLPWRGKGVPTAKPVLYVAGEGSYGLGVRALAWKQHRAKGAPDAGFYVLPFAVDMLNPRSVAAMVSDIEKFNVQFGLVVVDTVARNFGGGNENAAEDMNKFVVGVDKLRRALDGHVLNVHHSGKDAEKGERGSGALRAAVDASFKVSREDGSPLVRVKCVKQKDAPEPDPFSMRLELVEAVHPVTGEVVSSLLPVLDESSTSAKASARLGRIEREALAALEGSPSTLRTLGKRLGVDHGSLGRAIRSLTAKNFVRAVDGVYEITGGVSDRESNQEDVE